LLPGGEVRWNGGKGKLARPSTGGLEPKRKKEKTNVGDIVS